eukprot:TRINITY_DN10649_c0_g1_i1.p1 TRINITY_DN10649_c0_g1~~TRINITY_DN10649_c0_g1_i1.p1  ORF type:complete len:1013 (-),score=157.04 TRINITY_DN10649_c0_g1_i1:309-3347(-)
MFLRDPFTPLITNLRASYIDEIGSMFRFLDQLQITRVSIFYQNDTFGAAGLQGFNVALKSRGLVAESWGVYPRNTVAVQAGLENITMGSPQAIVMIGTYTPLRIFIEKLRAIPRFADCYFLTVSFVGAEAFATELQTNMIQPRGRIFVTQVVPSPHDTSVAVVKRYQNSLEAYKPGTVPTFGSLEGYLAGRMLAAILDSVTSPQVTVEDYENVIYNFTYFSLDGLLLGPFSTTPGSECNQALHYVWLSRIEDDYTYLLHKPDRISSCGHQSLLVKSPIVFGMIVPLSGPYVSIANAIKIGIGAAFQAVNLQGGVRGQMVSLLTSPSDDIETTIKNTRLLIAQGVYGITGVVGSDMTIVVQNITSSSRIPFVGPVSGELALSLSSYTINIRATISEEIAALVQFFFNKQVYFIGVVLPVTDNGTYTALGAVAAQGIDDAIHAYGLQYLTSIYVPNADQTDFTMTRGQLNKTIYNSSNLDALIIVGDAEPVAQFLAESLGKNPNVVGSGDSTLFSVQHFATLSLVGTDFVDLLIHRYSFEDQDLEKLLISQVVPLNLPSNLKEAIDIDFSSFSPSTLNSTYLNPFELEGYLTGRLIVQVLESLYNTTQENFLNSLYNTAFFSINGILLGPFQNDTTKCNKGIRQVWITNVTRTSDSFVYNQIDDTFHYSTCYYEFPPPPEPIIYYDCETHVRINDTARILDPTSNPSWIRGELLCDQLMDCQDLSDESNFCVTGAYIGLIVWSILSGFMVVCCFCVGYLLFKYWNRPIFKFAAPYFLLLILVGGIMVYIALPMNALWQETWVCNAPLWLIAVGFNLLVTSLVGKVWRIYYIVENAKVLKMKVITDKVLFCLVVVFLSITFLILSVWITTEMVEPKLVIHWQHPNFMRLMCYGKHVYVIGGILLGYNGFILLIGIFVGFKTRMSSEVLSESRALGLTIYQYIVLGVISIPLIIVLNEPAMRLNIINAIIWLAVTGTIVALFLPKVLNLDYSPNTRAMTSNRFTNTKSPQTQTSTS